ncbi:MAG TPA: alpha/beta fold hydrolase [Burkholderiaceae bacterium]|nr:alpha/beta fold hydrolase [Burkholderiaceae bacterium]
MSNRRRPILLIAACVLALSATAGYAWIDRWQRTAIFSVELGESRWWREPPPGTVVFDIPLPDQQKIRAWYLPQDRPDAPTVLYLHGSRWNLNDSVARIERWADMGFSVLAIDYRGFGTSSPLLPSESSVIQDATAALHELARRQPDAGRRFVYGHSLGGAVAVALSVQQDRPAIAGLIIESTFTNIRDMIAATRWSAIPGLRFFVTQPFDSLDAIKRIREPVLIIHGTEDRIVPHAMSDALFNAAGTVKGRLRRLLKIEGASHSGASRSGPVYTDTVTEFVKAVSTRYKEAPGQS